MEKPLLEVIRQDSRTCPGGPRRHSPSRDGEAPRDLSHRCQTPALGWSEARRTVIVLRGPRQRAQRSSTPGSPGNASDLRLSGLRMGLPPLRLSRSQNGTLRERSRHLRAPREPARRAAHPSGRVAAFRLWPPSFRRARQSPPRSPRDRGPERLRGPGWAGPQGGGGYGTRPARHTWSRGPGEAGRGCTLAQRRSSSPKLSSPEREEGGGLEAESAARGRDPPTGVEPGTREAHRRAARSWSGRAPAPRGPGTRTRWKRGWTITGTLPSRTSLGKAPGKKRTHGGPRRGAERDLGLVSVPCGIVPCLHHSTASAPGPGLWK